VFPEKTAIIYGDRHYSYREYGERVNRLATALRKAGLQRGERVAFLCPNTPPMLEAHFGVMLAGGILVCINTRLAAGEVAYILQHSGARFLFADTEYAELVRQVGDDCPALAKVINIVDEGARPAVPGPDYEGFLDTGSPDPPAWE